MEVVVSYESDKIKWGEIGDVDEKARVAEYLRVLREFTDELDELAADCEDVRLVNILDRYEVKPIDVDGFKRVNLVRPAKETR